MRIVEQSAGRAGGHRSILRESGLAGKRFLASRVLVPDSARQKSSHCVDDDSCSQFSAAQDVIADGDLAIGKMFADALVHALVSTADQDHTLQLRQVTRNCLREA